MSKKILNTLSFSLDTSPYTVYAANSTIYEDLIVNNYEIPLILTGSNGVYVFIPTADLNTIGNFVIELNKLFGLSTDNSFYFILTEDTDYILDEKLRPVKLDDMYQAFENLYSNLLRPAIELNYFNMTTINELIKEPDESLISNEEVIDTGDASFVREIINELNLSYIDENIENYISEYSEEEGFKVDEDGTEYVLKYDSSYKNSIKNSIVSQEKKWFRCSSNDSDHVCKLMIFGGWFGLHKFYDHKILQGILYALTCGCCGVYYVLDIVKMFLGSYYNKEVCLSTDEYNAPRYYSEKVYYKPLKNKKFAILGIFIALILSFILMNTLYNYGYTVFFDWLVEFLNSFASSNEILNGLESSVGLM